MKKWFLSIIFLFSLFACLFVCPIDVYATSPAPLEPAPTLQVVKPQLQAVQDEAVEYAFNKHAYVVPAEFHFYAFLDFVKAYGEANWTEEEDFQYYVQPVIDASCLPESLQGLDANIYMAYVDYGFMKVGGYFDSAGNLLGGEYVKFTSQMDSLVDAFIDQLVDDYYLPIDQNLSVGGSYVPNVNESFYLFDICSRFGIGVPDTLVRFKFANSTQNSYVFIRKAENVYSGFDYTYYLTIFRKNPIENLNLTLTSTSFYSYDNASRSYFIDSFNQQINGPINTNYFDFIKNGDMYMYEVELYSHFSNGGPAQIISPYKAYHYNSKQEFFTYFLNNIADLTRGGIKFFPNGNTDLGAVGGQVLKGDSLAPYNDPLRENITKPLIIPTNPIPAIIPPVNPVTPPAPTVIDDPAPSPSAPGSPTIPIQEQNPDLAPFMLDLSEKFPFCVPFDLVKAFKTLNKPAEVPHWEWTLNVPSIDFSYTFVLDLAEFESLAQILRIIIIISFIIELIILTRYIISG